MFQSKKRFFAFLSSREQSDVLQRLGLLARDRAGQSPDDQVADWIEAERDLLAAGASLRPWIEPHLDDEQFQKEAVQVLKEAAYKIQHQMQAKLREQAYKARLPATPKQVRYLSRLLKESGETPDGPIEELTRGQVSEWIEKLTGEPDEDE